MSWVTQAQRQATTSSNGIGAGIDDREALVREERKRYTERLQRRAQAHVTAELGAGSSVAELDRQIAMLIQHVLESTRARFVSLFRPVPRGERWHVTTVFEDGGFYYGLVVPSQLLLPMTAARQKQPVLLAPDRPRDPGLPRPAALGVRSYLAVPVLSGGEVVAVLEAVDVARPEELDRYATSAQQAALVLIEHLAAESQRHGWRPSRAPGQGLDEAVVLDLVLQPPGDADAGFEISPQEWALLNQLDGERSLGMAAAAAGLSLSIASTVATSLLERGLIRIGREDRRRR
jgi:GAF domain-containing protein